MKTFVKITFVLAIGFLLCPYFLNPAKADYVRISNRESSQGDTTVIFFSLTPEIKSATFDNEPIPFFKYKGNYAVVVPVLATKKPGNYPVKVGFSDGASFEKQIKVKARRFVKVVLGIPKELGLTARGLTAELKKENQVLTDIFDLKTQNIFFSQPFGLPLKNNKKITSSFGEIRDTNGMQIRHWGIDFSVPLGTPIGAINNGVVRRAYTDAVYGNSVVIDHGFGIFSAYFHLDKVKVKENDSVKKGQVIGTVGKTGYATAPHLHLSVKIFGISVDPLKIISVFK